MSGHVLDTILVGAIVAGAVTFLLRRACQTLCMDSLVRVVRRGQSEFAE